VPNITASSPLWLFDLDNTLHDASHAIFPAISSNMNTFIGQLLGDGVTPASQQTVDAVRIGYWKRYGATLTRHDPPPRRERGPTSCARPTRWTTWAR